jgi:anti-sigma B factor antagonist
MLRNQFEVLNGCGDLAERHTQHRATADSAPIVKLSVQEPRPGVRVIMVAGELDMLSAPTLEQAVHDQWVEGLRGLIIDLTELIFLGCAGILVLIHAEEAAQRANVPLRLVCNSQRLLRILRICGVLERFEVFDTLADAVSRHP